MFSGPPLPLSSDLPLSFLLAELRPSETLGAWVRCSRQQLRLHRAASGGGRVLVSADLGFLLRRCGRVALREGSEPVILEAETLIQWRTLQVITALPCLPTVERLSRLFPGVMPCGPGELLIPIPMRSPEEVLAECLATGVPVSGSRVVYYRPAGATGRRPVAQIL